MYPCKCLCASIESDDDIQIKNNNFLSSSAIFWQRRKICCFEYRNILCSARANARVCVLCRIRCRYVRVQETHFNFKFMYFSTCFFFLSFSCFFPLFQFSFVVVLPPRVLVRVLLFIPMRCGKWHTTWCWPTHFVEVSFQKVQIVLSPMVYKMLRHGEHGL